jgi:hypothetical protein
MNVSLCMYPELAVTWCAGRNLKLLRNQDVRFCSSASRAVTQEPLLFQQDLPPSWSMEDCFGRFDDSSAVWVWRLQWRKWESRRHQETFFLPWFVMTDISVRYLWKASEDNSDRQPLCCVCGHCAYGARWISWCISLRPGGVILPVGKISL